MFMSLNDEMYSDMIDYANTEVDELRKTREQTIAIMPAGNAGIDMLSHHCKANEIQVECFIDNNENKQWTQVESIDVLSLNDAKEKYPKLHVIVATLSAEVKKSIVTQLEKLNVEYILAEVFIYKNFNEYQKIYKMLADKTSQENFLNIINYRISSNISLLDTIARPAEYQYFEPDIYAVSSNDVFVDCGAYTGDTLTLLMKATNGEIKGYHGFEPSNDNFKELQQMSKSFPNMHLYNKGLHQTDTVLRFDTERSSASCTLSTVGNCEIAVVSLDSTLDKTPVTFIKMDIEGAEIAALEGAQNLIKREQPILAISVYHKPSDIIDIPILIDSFGVKYSYYLRHYYLYFNKDTVSHCESVLYAIPKKNVEGGIK